MKDLTLTIGHNVNGTPALTTAAILNECTLVLELDGLTTYECHGMWQGEFETSTRIEVCGLTRKQVKQALDRLPALAKALRQESIAYQVTRSNTRFASAA